MRLGTMNGASVSLTRSSIRLLSHEHMQMPATATEIAGERVENGIANDDPRKLDRKMTANGRRKLVEDTTKKLSWPRASAGILESARRRFCIHAALMLSLLVFGLASIGNEHGKGLHSDAQPQTSNGTSTESALESANSIRGPLGVFDGRSLAAVYKARGHSQDADIGVLDGLVLAAVDDPEDSVYAACWGVMEPRSDCTGWARRGVSSVALSIHSDDLQAITDIWGSHLKESHDGGARCYASLTWNCVSGPSKLRARAAASRELEKRSTETHYTCDHEFL